MSRAVRVRLSAFAERVRASLFFIPMMAVVAAVGCALAGIEVERRLGDAVDQWPFGLTSTVESARALLATIAGATITFAGIAFSVSLLTIQLASSQYSPRIVHTLFRDPFNKRVMALVVGTFAYCLMVLRAVRSALEQGGEPVVPNLSVAFALLLGVATILAIVAFINHNAHAMDVSEILARVTEDALDHVRQEWGEAVRPTPDPVTIPSRQALPFVVRFERSGWVQQIDFVALEKCMPEHATLRLDTIAGRYAVEETSLCALSATPEDVEEVAKAARRAVVIGDARTMQQDPSYGVRQLVDVALKALSPGINDPTTAQDAVFHSASVLGELLRRDPPPGRRSAEGDRVILTPQQHTHEQLVHLAFSEVRRAAAAQPAVCVYLLEIIELLCDSLDASGLGDRRGPLEEEARLVVEGCAAADVLDHDKAMVRDAHAKRFGPNRRRGR